MPDDPLVNVVIPTYDRPEMLARAVQSVESQSYSNLELIIVDGPSEVPAQEVVQELNLSINHKCLRNQNLQGLATARNNGIEIAQGEYIAFLDDDDEWREDKLQKQINRFESGDYGAVYCGVEQISENGTTNAIKTKSIEGDILPYLFSRNFIGTPSCVVVRADVVDSISGFDEDMETWEDWDFYIRIANNWHFGAVPEALVKRHHHADQMATDIENKENVAPLLFEKHKYLTHKYKKWSESEFKAGIDLYLVESNFTTGSYSRARHHIINALHRNPYKAKYYAYLALLSGGKYTFRPIQKFKRKIVDTLA